MARRNRVFFIVGAALTIWYVLVVVLWAVRPLSDSIPIGLDAAQRPVSQEVECNSLFDGAVRSKPLPVVAEPNEYTRDACHLIHGDARLVFGIDTAVYLLAIGAMVVVTARMKRSPDLSLT